MTSFLAVWDVYQLVPMLMALGIAIVTTFLALRTFRLITAADLSFYRYNLKSSGKIRQAGWAFLSLSILWIGLNAHSGWVRYNERAGTTAFESVRIPDELALARPNPDRWLSQSDRQNITEGKAHFRSAMDAGLFVNKEALPKLAWLEYLSGNTEQAADLLGTAAEYQTGQGQALSLYYRGAILNRLGRHDEALRSLELALAERPDLVVAAEEKGEALWHLGRRTEAVSVWNDTIARTPGLPITANFLAGAAAAAGDPNAAAYQQQADRITPADPLFHWMLGLRLQNIGMNDQANKHFERAIQLNPQFKRALN